jgi:hypothetical protein
MSGLTESCAEGFNFEKGIQSTHGSRFTFSVLIAAQPGINRRQRDVISRKIRPSGQALLQNG